ERGGAQPSQMTGQGDEAVPVRVGREARHDGGGSPGGGDRAVVVGQPRQAHLDHGRPAGVAGHRMKLGSHSASHGKAARMASRSTSTHMKGSTPLKMVPVLSSGM